MKALWIPVLALLCLLGCGGGPLSEEEYATAFRRECEAYRKMATEIAAKPLPPRPKTREERMDAMAKRIHEDNTSYQKLAADFQKLKPPAKLANLHSAYQEFLNGQIRINKQYASALEAHDTEQAKKANGEYVDFLGSQMGKVLSEIEKGGANVASLRQDLTEIMEEAH